LEGKGIVKWFHADKGYGFITLEGTNKDVFVHHSKIVMDGFRNLMEGQPVHVIYEPGEKGLAASEVRPL